MHTKSFECTFKNFVCISAHFEDHCSIQGLKVFFVINDVFKPANIHLIYTSIVKITRGAAFLNQFSKDNIFFLIFE